MMKKGWHKKHRDEFLQYMRSVGMTHSEACKAFWNFIDVVMYVPKSNNGADDAKYFIDYERNECA